MAIDGQALTQGFSDFLGDRWDGTTTSVGSDDKDTLFDSALQERGSHTLRDGFIRITHSGHAALWEVRSVAEYEGAGAGLVTLTAPFGSAIGSGVGYEYHDLDPRLKFKALDRARIYAYPQLAQVHMNDELTADGIETEYDIPSELARGPLDAFRESPYPATSAWNVLADPELRTLSTKWAASSLTATLHGTITETDRLVPKHEDNCVHLVGANGTYAQVVGAMTDITAALAAGRSVVFGMWVYCRTASRVSVRITDDNGTTSSSEHAGKGWEFLTVTLDVVSTNSLLLTVDLRINGGNDVSIFAERAYLKYGKTLRVPYPTYLRQRTVIRDNSQAIVIFQTPPHRGFQLRLIGRELLSALGGSATTQVTNTMEVDVWNAELLYAHAARLLFEDAKLNLASYQQGSLNEKIGTVMQRFAEIAEDAGHEAPYGDTISGHWEAP